MYRLGPCKVMKTRLWLDLRSAARTALVFKRRNINKTNYKSIKGKRGNLAHSN